METAVLEKLQETEFEILVEIDKYCKDKQICYSLYGGTLLGAVRHNGFIPWDDDIDIVMTRDQYTRFCNAWEHEPIVGYYLENYETDKHTQNVHSKVRKDGTVFLSDIEDETIGHHGIWVDIFVMDKVPIETNKGKRIIACGRKIILMTKANGILPGESLKKRIARRILRLIYPEKTRFSKLREMANFLRDNENKIKDEYELCDMCTIEYLHVRFPKETGKRFVLLQFKNQRFPAFDNYDDVLKIMYGNYMILPPEGERVCRHNPKKMVFQPL